MTKLTPSRMIAIATLAAVAVSLATPAFAMSYGRNGVERSDIVFVPADSECTGHRTWCDMPR